MPTKQLNLVKTFLIPLLILTLAIGAFIGLKNTRPEAPAKPVASKRWPVEAILAQSGSYAPEIQLLGRVESPYQSTLTAAVTGYVSRVHALEGDLLNSNQLLIELSPEDSEILLSQRQAELDNLKAQISSERLQHQNNQAALKQEQALLKLTQGSVKRLTTLNKQGSASQSALEEAQQAVIRQQINVLNRELSIRNFSNRLAQLQAQLSRQQSLYDQAQLDLTRTQARTPYNARISQLLVAPGDRVTPGTRLARVYPYDQLEVRTQLPSHWLEQIQGRYRRAPLQARTEIHGQSYQLELDRLSGEISKGQGGTDGLFRFLPVQSETRVDPEKKLQQTTPVNRPLTLHNTSDGLHTLPIGQNIALTLYLPAIDNSIALPGSAFYGQDRIYSIVDDKLVSHQIKRLGTVSQGFDQPHILISAADIPTNSQLLVTQLPNAISGLSVRISSQANNNVQSSSGSGIKQNSANSGEQE